MPSTNGWETAGLHPKYKKLLAEETGATVQLKVQTGGAQAGQMRLYAQTPAEGWTAIVLDAEGNLLGHGLGPTRKAAREMMLAAAGLAK
jgi:hypothetical protein